MLKVRWIEGIPVRYRPDTTDEKVIREVVDRKGYRRVTYPFDVMPGETWLDLGANIGAFAVYCKLKGAVAECYEPDKDCFDILVRNADGFICHNSAVTNLNDDRISFYRSKNSNRHSRGSIVNWGPSCVRVKVSNTYAGLLKGRRYDGVKMDVEGSEMGLIDDDLIPQCNKLCMEYHTSRDPCMSSLKTRLDKLRSRFDYVRYPAELDRKMQEGGDSKTYFDRFIFCWKD